MMIAITATISTAVNTIASAKRQRTPRGGGSSSRCGTYGSIAGMIRNYIETTTASPAER